MTKSTPRFRMYAMEGKFYAVIDTNVIVPAVKWGFKLMGFAQ